MGKPFTPKQAKAWLAILENTHVTACDLLNCSIWAINSLNQIKESLLFDSNVRSLNDFFDIAAWPDKENRNFETLGRDLDQLFHKLNSELPESNKGTRRE